MLKICFSAKANQFFLFLSLKLSKKTEGMQMAEKKFFLTNNCQQFGIHCITINITCELNVTILDIFSNLDLKTDPK